MDYKLSKHHYVTNPELIEALRTCKQEKAEGRAGVEGKEDSVKYKRAYDKVGAAILLISNNLIKRPEFSGYPKQVKQEMVSDSILNVCLYIDNFDPDYVGPKSGQVNAFGYITQICWYAFVRGIQKEKKQLRIKAKIIRDSGITDQIDARIEGDDRQYANEFLDTLKSYQNYLEDELPADDTAKKERKRKKKASQGLGAVFEDVTEAEQDPLVDDLVEEDLFESEKYDNSEN